MEGRQFSEKFWNAKNLSWKIILVRMTQLVMSRELKKYYGTPDSTHAHECKATCLVIWFLLAGIGRRAEAEGVLEG